MMDVTTAVRRPDIYRQKLFQVYLLAGACESRRDDCRGNPDGQRRTRWKGRAVCFLCFFRLEIDAMRASLRHVAEWELEQPPCRTGSCGDCRPCMGRIQSETGSMNLWLDAIRLAQNAIAEWQKFEQQLARELAAHEREKEPT